MNNKVLYRIIRANGKVEGPHVQSNLRTNDGINWQAAHMGSASIAPIRNIAVTENADAPASGDTNLLSEEAADGLSRTTATYSHTADASSYTQTATWQYTGGSTKTIAKAAMVHDAADTDASTDTHFVITALSPVAVLDSNDTLEIAWGIFY